MREYTIDNIEIKRHFFFIKIARCKNEWLEDSKDPQLYAERLKGIADIFTFWQRPPNIKPKYNFRVELDNMAVLFIRDYDFWWRRQIDKKTRNMVRKSQRKGVKVAVTLLTDDFLSGIVRIYNETPIRQCRLFKHYGRTFEEVKIGFTKNPYPQDFIGAYYEGELIGFMQIIYSGECALISQILAMIKHWDKAPNNLMIAKAVEVCSSKKVKYLIYGRMGAGSLDEFKRNNGFIKLYIPRYYVPLSIKGRIAIFLNLHKGVGGLLPEKIKNFLRPKRDFLLRLALRSNIGRNIIRTYYHPT